MRENMIHIVTDSTCEGPAEAMTHPAVHVLPLSVVFGHQALRDGAEITREEFWARLPQANPLPTTSQATPGDFAQPFQQITDAGDEVVAIVLSSRLSGTYDSAIQALETVPGRAIDVVDSLSVSVGLGLMVHEALKMVDAGATRPEIVHHMMQIRHIVNVLFTLETLEYIQRGGRIGKAQALVGTLLKFKPLLGIQAGEVIPVGRVRTKRKALEAMLDYLTEAVPTRGPQVRLGVTHAGADEETAQVSQALCERFETPHIFTCTLGPVIGVHVGPGTIGVAVYPGAAE
jgi:DegV family protein with EDD domain